MVFCKIPLPLRSTLFPYPTLFRTIAGLTQNSCNTTAVTCEIVGSVDPANPSARKKLTATAQEDRKSTRLNLSKVKKSDAGPCVEKTILPNNEDGTAKSFG